MPPVPNSEWWEQDVSIQRCVDRHGVEYFLWKVNRFSERNLVARGVHSESFVAASARWYAHLKRNNKKDKDDVILRLRKARHRGTLCRCRYRRTWAVPRRIQVQACVLTKRYARLRVGCKHLQLVRRNQTVDETAD